MRQREINVPVSLVELGERLRTTGDGHLRVVTGILDDGSWGPLSVHLDDLSAKSFADKRGARVDLVPIGGMADLVDLVKELPSMSQGAPNNLSDMHLLPTWGVDSWRAASLLKDSAYKR
jgi:hypothetical protein